MGVAAGWYVESISRSSLFLAFLALLDLSHAEASKAVIGNLHPTREFDAQCVGEPWGLNAAALLQVQKPSKDKKKEGKKKGGKKSKKTIFQPYVDPPDMNEVPDVTQLTPETATVDRIGQTRDTAQQLGYDPESTEFEAAIDKFADAMENPLEASEKAENETVLRVMAYRRASGAIGDPVTEMKHKEAERKLQEVEERKKAEEVAKKLKMEEAARESEDDGVPTEAEDVLDSMKQTAETAMQLVPGSAKILSAAQERLPGAYGFFNPTSTTTQAPSTTPKPCCPKAGQKCAVILEFATGDEAEQRNTYLYGYDQIANISKFERSNSYILDFGSSRPKKCCQIYQVLRDNPEVVFIKMDVPIYPN